MFYLCYLFIYLFMLEKTLLIIKPDAVEKKIVGRIISILENNNIDILFIKKIFLSRNEAENFYFEHKNKDFYLELIDFMTSGNIYVLILSGISVVSNVRNLIGHTNHKLAASGTIRSIFASSMTKNAVHASDSFESFLREAKVLFNLNF